MPPYALDIKLIEQFNNALKLTQDIKNRFYIHNCFPIIFSFLMIIIGTHHYGLSRIYFWSNAIIVLIHLKWNKKLIYLSIIPTIILIAITARYYYYGGRYLLFFLYLIILSVGGFLPLLFLLLRTSWKKTELIIAAWCAIFWVLSAVMYLGWFLTWNYGKKWLAVRTGEVLSLGLCLSLISINSLDLSGTKTDNDLSLWRLY